MATRTSVVPIQLGQALLGTGYSIVYEVPSGKTGATVRGLVVSNGDVTAGVPTAHRVWVHMVKDGDSPSIENALLFDQEFINGIDGDGVLTMEPGDTIQAKADVGSKVGITVSGAETLTEVIA